MLGDVQYYTWTRDSGHIAYISFLSLIITPVNGRTYEKIDLTGMNNFKSILSDPEDPDKFLVCARDASGDISFFFYIVSRKDTGVKILKKGLSFWEFSYDISPDGKYLVYSSKVN